MSDDCTFEIIEAVADGRARAPRTSRQDNFTRMDVVNAFQRAFTMIGGIQRLALWGNAHPDKFYPLYARMMPATSINFGTQARQIIEHSIPPSTLDEHPIPNVYVPRENDV